MTKFVFLDIDGVLNTTGDKELISNTFEKKKLENLVELLRTTDSILVVTSDRRLIEEERLMIEDVFDPYYIFFRFHLKEYTQNNLLRLLLN